MVSTMASAYNGLSEAERERVFLQAVGFDRLKNDDSKFCKGIAACHDERDNPWWVAWDADPRDIFFFTKQANGSWEYYCRYSMQNNSDELDATIREMLDGVDIMTDDDFFVGNETQTCSVGPLAGLGPSSSSKSHYAVGATMLATVLGWLIL